MKPIYLGAVAVAFASFFAGCAEQEAPESSVRVFEAPEWDGLPWFKGNTHTHTTESDGDSSPEYVIGWYQDHGYDFLVLSDHNVFVDPARYADIVEPGFELIAGEEVTSSFDSHPVHVNGLGLPHVVEPRVAESLVATIQANVDAIRDVEGVPHINHPNFGWSFSVEELAQVENDRLLEIFNGHPTVHNVGGGGIPGMEKVWDILLSGGKRIYGIAVDDAHNFQGEFSPERSNPGRGWISVKAGTLDGAEILRNLEEGWFYASTGVEIADVVVNGNRIEVHIEQDRNFRYTTEFITTHGRLAHTTVDNPAVFELESDEVYVRAKVIDSRGDVAWIQPVFVEGSAGR